MMRLAYLAFRIYCFLFQPVTLGVRVMLIRNRQVLLVRHTYQEGWFLPGGGIKRGESFEQAARREATEEVGAEMMDIRFIGLYSCFTEWKSDHNVLFLSQDFTASHRHDAEIAESRFFPLEALPETLWPGHRRRLEEYQAGVKPAQIGEW